jgi:hypothetical protein
MKDKTEFYITPISLAMIALSEIGLESTSKAEQINLLAVCKTLESMLDYEHDYIKSKIEIARGEGFIQGSQEALRMKFKDINKK